MEDREPLTSYHRSLDVQGGLWALVGGRGLEAITGRISHHVPPAGQVTSELQAELWSRLQAESTGCSQGKCLFGGSTGLSLTHGGSWHSQNLSLDLLPWLLQQERRCRGGLWGSESRNPILYKRLTQ